MTSERPTAREQPQSAEQSVPPHPVLSAHYGSPEERVGYIGRLFDTTADRYDRINRWMSLDRGEWYRRDALVRAGVRLGDRLLDVGAGTGVLAANAQGLVGELGQVIAIDPSLPMLRVAGQRGVEGRVQSIAERLPVADDSIDFIAMGYALRHVADLATAFGELGRALRPGGRLLILEMVPPSSPSGYLLTKLYLKYLVPTIAFFVAGGSVAQRLMRYYWDSIEQCVPPEVVLGALRAADFRAVERQTRFGILAEYTAIYGRPPSE